MSTSSTICEFGKLPIPVYKEIFNIIIKLY